LRVLGGDGSGSAAAAGFRVAAAGFRVAAAGFRVAAAGLLRRRWVLDGGGRYYAAAADF
jgi:hypothetical protein